MLTPAQPHEPWFQPGGQMTDPIKWFISILGGCAEAHKVEEQMELEGKEKRIKREVWGKRECG